MAQRVLRLMQDAKDHNDFSFDFVINAVGCVNEAAGIRSNYFDVSAGERIRGQHLENFYQIKRVGIGLDHSVSVDRIAINALEISFGIGRQLISGH